MFSEAMVSPIFPVQGERSFWMASAERVRPNMILRTSAKTSFLHTTFVLPLPIGLAFVIARARSDAFWDSSENSISFHALLCHDSLLCPFTPAASAVTVMLAEA